jgi:hypothetical protein
LVYFSFFDGLSKFGKAGLEFLSSEVFLAASEKLKYSAKICLHFFIDAESSIESQCFVEIHVFALPAVQFLDELADFSFLEMESLAS